MDVRTYIYTHTQTHNVRETALWPFCSVVLPPSANNLHNRAARELRSQGFIRARRCTKARQKLADVGATCMRAVRTCESATSRFRSFALTFGYLTVPALTRPQECNVAVVFRRPYAKRDVLERKRRQRRQAGRQAGRTRKTRGIHNFVSAGATEPRRVRGRTCVQVRCGQARVRSTASERASCIALHLADAM